MTYPILTTNHLRAAGACADQITLFRRTFPDGARLTRANLIAAHRAGLDVLWCGHLLPPVLRDEYERQTAPLDAEYERRTALLYAEYERQIAPLWAEHERQCASLWAEYERQCAPLRADYERQCAPLRAEYERQCALLLLSLVRVALTERSAAS